MKTDREFDKEHKDFVNTETDGYSRWRMQLLTIMHEFYDLSISLRVYTGGTFDMFHRGHALLFKRIKEGTVTT